MKINPIPVKDIKVFAPAKDFETSLAFYKALGWTCNWSNNMLAELALGEHRFLLQNYYHKEWADNFMFYIQVEDVEACYKHVKEVLTREEFSKARIKAPAPQDYGDIVCFVWDPSGILLHFAQPAS